MSHSEVKALATGEPAADRQDEGRCRASPAGTRRTRLARRSPRMGEGVTRRPPSASRDTDREHGRRGTASARSDGVVSARLGGPLSWLQGVSRSNVQEGSRTRATRADRRLGAENPQCAGLAQRVLRPFQCAAHRMARKVRLARRTIGCWQVGSSFPLMPRSGRRGRRFKSGHPDRETAGHKASRDLLFALRVSQCPILGARWERTPVTVEPLGPRLALPVEGVSGAARMTGRRRTGLPGSRRCGAAASLAAFERGPCSPDPIGCTAAAAQVSDCSR